jgi:flagellar motility protein MotE (MotC chaperone)
MATDNNTNQPTVEVQAPKEKSWFGRFMAFKSLLVSISIAGLIATNVASIVNDTVHDYLYRALWGVVAIGGEALAQKAMNNSFKAKTEQKIKAQTAKLEAENKQLNSNIESKNKKITDLETNQKTLTKKIDDNGKFAKKTATKLRKRLAAGVARNLANLPSKAAPYIGVTFIVASTSLDIYDACQTMKDFNELLVLLGQGEEESDICGQKVPSADEVKASVKKVFEKKDGG